MSRRVQVCLVTTWLGLATVVGASVDRVVPAASSEEDRESVLDRVVHLEDKLHTEIPATPRWCERLKMEGRRIDVGDARLYVEVEGEGPALVLINGGPGGTHHYFHPWFSRAAQYAQVVYYDQRGCGLSDFEPGESGYSVDQAVADLDAIRQALGLEEWSLLGYSYGGFLAQLYAIRHPEHVAGLILLGAEPGMWADLGESRQEDFLSQAEQDKKKQVLAQLREMREQNGWSRREYVQRVIYNYQLNGDWKRQHFFRPSRERTAQVALFEWDNDGDFNAVMGRTRDRIDLTGAFESNPIPTLILEGECDRTWGEKKRATLVANHPRARSVVFEGTAHGVYDEQPGAFFPVLAEFMGSLSDVSPEAIAEYREALRQWKVAQQATPLYKLRSLGWGRASSDKLAASYERGWLELFPEPQNLLRIGFAMYDVENYGEALRVFESMERSAAAANNPSYESVALIWQGHMLDLLDRRPEAKDRYREAVELGVDETWHHSVYDMEYQPKVYAAERLATPFARVENKDPE